MGRSGDQENQRPVPPAPAASRPVPGYLATPVESKLHPPDQRKEWIPRHGLVRILLATEAKLVLVQAPAGYGKTIAVAQWRGAAIQGRPFAWVSLDRGDDDPAHLWWHVACALQRASPGLGGGTLLRSFRARDPDITERPLPHLVNAVANLAEPVVLVLDNYHLVTEQRCHEQVAFLLRNLLPPAQIVLITRTSPPLHLARLRAAGDLAELGMNELRMDVGEVADLVAAVAGVRLDDRDLADLTGRTEGWPAAVYLAALSLRGATDPRGMIRRFTGGNRHIADFLFEEVISRQPDHVVRFLTNTAILDRFTAPLCAAVTGMADAAGIIDVLERENLFLVALDASRQWFRYHHLFAQTLRSRLALREPVLMPALHRRASAWFRDQGLVDEAVDHARAAGDVAGTVDLIAGHWYAYVNAGRTETVRGWIKQLSDEQVTADPLAAHCAAWVAALSGEPETVQRLIPVVEEGKHAGALPDGMRSLKFSAALLRGAFGFDGIRVMRESAARAVEMDDDPQSPWRVFALAAYGFSLHLSGDSRAAETLRKGMLTKVDGPLVRLAALCGGALLAAEDGRLDQARALADAARQIADGNGLRDLPQSTLAHTVTGVVRAQEGRLQEARSELEHALRSRRKWLGLSPWPTVEALIRLASVLCDQGDGTRAAALLAEARDVLIALPDGAEAQHARLERLQRRLSGAPGGTALAEPLTGRETTVLRLLRGALSRGEIARHLGLSPNTVRSHTRAIYRKLGVSTRRAAVSRGRELGLL
jgi:LuxR family maltose regulon positive regulatory protein